MYYKIIIKYLSFTNFYKLIELDILSIFQVRSNPQARREMKNSFIFQSNSIKALEVSHHYDKTLCNLNALTSPRSNNVQINKKFSLTDFYRLTLLAQFSLA